jgi:hypothetical protein
MIGELKKLWKGTVVAYFNAISQYLSVRSEVSHN